MQTKILSMRFLILLLLGGSFIYTSCSGSNNNETPKARLNAYCVRECVLETGDSEVCDTRCKCASKSLSEKLSADEISKLVSSLPDRKAQASSDSESKKEFKDALKRCKSAKF